MCSILVVFPVGGFVHRSFSFKGSLKVPKLLRNLSGRLLLLRKILIIGLSTLCCTILNVLKNLDRIFGDNRIVKYVQKISC